ncbi:hypothetical protein BT69DRAFT_738768 [Atractiella rhizophila]|nr:hypothetical protein BT69DRAFT_738768 [Atractiella rhizophila]
MNTESRSFFFFEEVAHPVSDESYTLRIAGRVLEALVTFDRGTYKLVFDSEGGELLPSTHWRAKVWLQGQDCPSPCTWRYKGKKYHEILAHVLTCQFRRGFNDPLKELCRLWKAKAYPVKTE